MSVNIDYCGGLPTGWRALFAKLVADLEAIDPAVHVVRAKQKFGEMRVYLDRGSPALMALLDEAERLSLVTCEECGAEAWLRKNARGIWRTLCDDHAGNFVRIVARPWSDVMNDVLLEVDEPVGDINDEAHALWEQRRNAARFKCQIVEEAGGVLDAEAVRVLLELGSSNDVRIVVQQRRLLAVDDAGRLWFPNCQFAEGRVLPGIQAILQTVPGTSGWRILQFLYSREDGLAGDRPIDLISRSQVGLERARQLARRLEQ